MEVKAKKLERQTGNRLYKSRAINGKLGLVSIPSIIIIDTVRCSLYRTMTTVQEDSSPSAATAPAAASQVGAAPSTAPVQSPQAASNGAPAKFVYLAETTGDLVREREDVRERGGEPAPLEEDDEQAWDVE